MRKYLPPSEPPDESIESVQKILVAATRLFSCKPTEMVKVQEIASESGVKLSLIYHHYGTKDYLYKVVFERAMERHRESLLRFHKHILEPEKLDRDQAVALLCLIICVMVDDLYDNAPDKSWHAKFTLLETTYPSAYFDDFFEKYLKPHHYGIARVVRQAMGEADQDDAILKTATIVGQILIFRSEREMMKRLIGIEGYSHEVLTRIKKIVLRNVLLQIGMNHDYTIRYDLIREMGSEELHAHAVNV